MNTIHTNNLTAEEKAYLAGLFDGEGSVNIFKVQRKDRIAPTYFVEISLGNTHKGVLEWVLKKFGGRVTHNAEQYSHRNQRTWRWRASTQDAAVILTTILPYLIIKKEQAELAIAFQERVTSYIADSRNILTQEEVEWRDSEKARLSTIRRYKENVEPELE